MSGQTEYEIHVTLPKEGSPELAAAIRVLNDHGAVVTTVIDRYVDLDDLSMYVRAKCRSPIREATHMWNILIRNTGSYRFHNTPFMVIERSSGMPRAEYLAEREKEEGVKYPADQWLISVNSLKRYTDKFIGRPPKRFTPLDRKLLKGWVGQL